MVVQRGDETCCIYVPGGKEAKVTSSKASDFLGMCCDPGEVSILDQNDQTAMAPSYLATDLSTRALT